MSFKKKKVKLMKYTISQKDLILALVFFFITNKLLNCVLFSLSQLFNLLVLMIDTK